MKSIWKAKKKKKKKDEKNLEGKKKKKKKRRVQRQRLWLINGTHQRLGPKKNKTKQKETFYETRENIFFETIESHKKSALFFCFWKVYRDLLGLFIEFFSKIMNMFPKSGLRYTQA